MANKLTNEILFFILIWYSNDTSVLGNFRIFQFFLRQNQSPAQNINVLIYYHSSIHTVITHTNDEFFSIHR